MCNRRLVAELWVAATTPSTVWAVLCLARGRDGANPPLMYSLPSGCAESPVVAPSRTRIVMQFVSLLAWSSFFLADARLGCRCSAAWAALQPR